MAAMITDAEQPLIYLLLKPLCNNLSRKAVELLLDVWLGQLKLSRHPHHVCVSQHCQHSPGQHRMHFLNWKSLRQQLVFGECFLVPHACSMKFIRAVQFMPHPQQPRYDAPGPTQLQSTLPADMAFRVCTAFMLPRRHAKAH